MNIKCARLGLIRDRALKDPSIIILQDAKNLTVVSLSAGNAPAEVGHVGNGAADTRGEQRPGHLPHNRPRARSQADGCRPCIAAQHMGRRSEARNDSEDSRLPLQSVDVPLFQKLSQ